MPIATADTDRAEKPLEGRWLTIHEACAFLGVDQSTLRRWSDAGKVPVFRTPGGHRRYAEADLQALVGAAARRIERPRLSRQQLTDRSLSAYEEAFWRGARERRWFAHYVGSQHEELRHLGRRLVDLAVRYGSASPGSDRTEVLEEGREIGRRYGRFGAGAEMTAAEAVEAFLYFRMPVIRSVAASVQEQGLAGKRAAELFAEIGQFLDQVLIATMHAHQVAVHSAALPDQPPADPGIEGASV
jgi:excisionase family DNA binding protein